MNYDKYYTNHIQAIGQIECLRILARDVPQTLKTKYIPQTLAAIKNALSAIDMCPAVLKVTNDLGQLFPVLLKIKTELLDIIAVQPRLLSKEADETAREVLDSICISYRTCTLCPTREAISSKLSQIKTDSKYYRDACRYMCLLEVAPLEVLKYIREDFLMTFDTNKTVSAKTSIFD